MSQLNQAQFEALYNSSGSGTFATNSSNNIGSASFRAFAKDISDSLFSMQNLNPDINYVEGDDFVFLSSATPATTGNTPSPRFDITKGGTDGTSSVAISTFGVDNTAPALGVVGISTGTGAANTISWKTSSTLKMGLGHSIVFKFRVAAEVLSDATNTYTIYIGLGDTTGAEPVNGVYFKYTHGTNSGKYQCVTSSASTRTATDSGVSQTTLYKTFEMRLDSASASVVFLIDGAVVATNTTNIPSAAISGLFTIVKSAGTTARLIDIDWYSLSIIRTSAR